MGSEAVTRDELELARADVLSVLEDNKDEFDAKFDQVKAGWDPTPIEFCLSKYITAELDFQTPGDRGLGRISTSP